MRILNTLKALKILWIGLTVFICAYHVTDAAQNAQAEKQARQREIANRIAFEKEQAQKQILQRQEDERKVATRQQQTKLQVQQQTIPQTPQTITHQDGKSFTSSLMGGVMNAAKSTNTQNIPGFKTDKPKEASFQATDLGDAALSESRTNTVSQHLTASAKDRPTFKFDPNTDPLFVNANNVNQNPLKTLNEQISELAGSDNIAEEIKTCEEGGDEYQQSCAKRLEIELKITPEVRTNVSYCPGHAKKERRGWSFHYSHWTEYCVGCATRVDVTPRKVEVIREQWVDNCSVLEDHVEQGLCRYTNATKSPHNETRTIQGEPVTRDHFEEHYQYACFKLVSTANTCAGLREKGCYQIKSVCKEKAGNQCVIWTQTFSCPTGKRSTKHYQASNKANPFCLTGNCADTSYEANGELLSVMSHLQTLRDAQEDLSKIGVIFKGQHRWCTRNCLDFRDCCGSGKGWGVTLHLSSCDSKEIELRTLRDKNLCIQMGTYCAERDKVFNSCLRKKTTFCCYGTKLARLIQQNAHAQLGIGWGDVKSPDCNGLSPEQLSRVDFSKIDFSEIFEEIKSKTVAKGQTQSLAQVSSERLQGNMALLTKPSSDPITSQKKQALKDKGL